MKEDRHTFVSPHGTLIVSPNGVTIKRTWSQALQSGRLIPREQTMPYSSLEGVKRQRARANNEYLQLTSKPGSPKITPLNRRTRLKFDARQAHHFRQAEKLIRDKISQQQEIPSASSDQPSSSADDAASPPAQPSFPGLRFRK